MTVFRVGSCITFCCNETTIANYLSMNKADQTPFLRLLIPVVAGILFCRFISASINLYSLGLIGLLIILFSFLKRNYSLRGIFGVGLMLFLFSFTVQSYQYQAKKVSYNFPEESQSYIAKILDLPQQKSFPGSLLLWVQLHWRGN